MKLLNENIEERELGDLEEISITLCKLSSAGPVSIRMVVADSTVLTLNPNIAPGVLLRTRSP